MIQNRVRLIGLALVVFILVPWLVLRHIDQAESARQSREGKIVLVHYWGIPDYAQTTDEQVNISVYQRFLDPKFHPENKDVIIDKFSGLEIRDMPGSWDAMIQMAFAADRAPDIVELISENIQTHRDEQFIRALPDNFTFPFTNSVYDELTGFSRHAADKLRAEHARQDARFEPLFQEASRNNWPDTQWLPQAALNYELAMMRKIAEVRGEVASGDHPPFLLDLLDTWNDLMRKCGRLENVVLPAAGIATSQRDGLRTNPSQGLGAMPATAVLSQACPGGQPNSEDMAAKDAAMPPATFQQAWNQWLFEKMLLYLPADLMSSLYDVRTGKLYGVSFGYPGLMSLRYRIKPFREANLIDHHGRAVLPQSWDELEYWSICFSLMGEGARSNGRVGYKLCHGQLFPWCFPLFAYGAGGQIVVPVNAQEADSTKQRWVCKLDSPGTIRGMNWISHLATLKPFKVDFTTADKFGAPVTVPLVLIYADYGQGDLFNAVPDFYLRLDGGAGQGQQPIFRRLSLGRDWSVRDGDKVLLRFSSEQDLKDKLRGPVSRAGPCLAVRAMDQSDDGESARLWDEDNLVMDFQDVGTLVVANPTQEGLTRFPDGPPWDLKIGQEELKDAAAFRQLQVNLVKLGVKITDAKTGATRDPNVAVSDQEWTEVEAFLRLLVSTTKGASDRTAPAAPLASSQPAPLKRVLDEMAALSMPLDFRTDGKTLALVPARPSWVNITEPDVDRRTNQWAWVFLVSPDGKTIVTVDRKYLIQRTEYEAWPGGPRFTAAPELVAGTEGNSYVQFKCGLQVAGTPDQMRKDTWRIQVSVIDAGMLALNHRLNDRTDADRKKLDAAVRLLRYLAGDEAQRITVEKKVQSGGGLSINPVQLRKFGFDRIADEIPPEYEAAMRDLRHIGRAVPQVPNYRGFQQFLGQLGDRLVISREDPAATCRAVTETVNNRFLSDPDEARMAQRRTVAWVIFGLVAGSLLVAGVWMGRQLLRGVTATAAPTDAEIGSVGQRPTWRTHLAAWMFLGPAVLSIFVWSYVPLGWGSVMAFMDYHVVKPTQIIGLDNFIKIFVDPHFYRILANTGYFVLLSLSLGFLAPVVLALMLNEIPWLKAFYRTVFYLPAITSGLVIMLMWKRFYDQDKEGLLNSLLLDLNGLNPATFFTLKLLGLAAVLLLAVLLFLLPLMDEIETKFGRFLAGLLPVSLTLWLGGQMSGNPLGIDLGEQPGWFAAAACLFAGLLMIRLAYRCEHELASRRIPWAAPGMVLIFLAGWFLRIGRGIAVDPNSTTAHLAQLFVLMIPLLGVWPLLRKLFGREHSPRETMYLLLKARDGKETPIGYSLPCRLTTIIAGVALFAAFVAPAVKGIGIGSSSFLDAHRYLLGGTDSVAGKAGLLFNPVTWLLTLALFAVLVFKRRPKFATALLGGYLLAILIALALPGDPGSAWGGLRTALVGGGGWLLRPFLFEPLLWLKDANLAMLCIILPGVWAGMGPGCLIYLAGLKGIPEDVYEAADLDGATSLQKVWTITVPHLMALLIINFVGAFIGAFQASQNVLVMTAGGPADATMVLGLEVWVDAFVLLRFGYATALAWILGLMLIGFTMYQISILKKVQFKTTGSAK